MIQNINIFFKEYLYRGFSKVKSGQVTELSQAKILIYIYYFQISEKNENYIDAMRVNELHHNLNVTRIQCDEYYFFCRCMFEKLTCLKGKFL